MDPLQIARSCRNIQNEEAAAIDEDVRVIDYFRSMEHRIFRIRHGEINQQLSVIEERLAPVIHNIISLISQQTNDRSNRHYARQYSPAEPHGIPILSLARSCYPIEEREENRTDVELRRAQDRIEFLEEELARRPEQVFGRMEMTEPSMQWIPQNRRYLYANDNPFDGYFSTRYLTTTGTPFTTTNPEEPTHGTVQQPERGPATDVTTPDGERHEAE